MNTLQTIGAEIKRLHSEIIGSAKTTLDKAIRIGELLARAKEQVAHGNWLPWLENNVSFSERTAQNYLRCYANRDALKSATVADLNDAYRLLALPSGDEPGNPDSVEPALRSKDFLKLKFPAASEEKLEIAEIICDLLAQRGVRAIPFEYVRAYVEDGSIQPEPEGRDDGIVTLEQCEAQIEEGLHEMKQEIEELIRLNEPMPGGWLHTFEVAT